MLNNIIVNLDIVNKSINIIAPHVQTVKYDVATTPHSGITLTKSKNLFSEIFSDKAIIFLYENTKYII